MLGKKYIDEQVALIRAEIKEALSLHVESIVTENETLKDEVKALNLKLTKLNLQTASRFNTLAMRKPWKT